MVRRRVCGEGGEGGYDRLKGRKGTGLRFGSVSGWVGGWMMELCLGQSFSIMRSRLSGTAGVPGLKCLRRWFWNSGIDVASKVASTFGL